MSQPNAKYKNNDKAAIWQLAKRLMPGGVNSPVRAFGSVGVEPVIVESAQGPYITDIEGRRYIDYVCSYGPLIFGHAPQFVTEAVQEAAGRGTTYGFTTTHEVELAELIAEAYPACEMLRMVNSGTEATMSAIRVARGCTGRSKLVKFEGCYHFSAPSGAPPPRPPSPARGRKRASRPGPPPRQYLRRRTCCAGSGWRGRSHRSPAPVPPPATGGCTGRYPCTAPAGRSRTRWHSAGG